MMGIEEIVMQIVSSSGEAKSHCYRALERLAEGRFEAGLGEIAEADRLLQSVHEIHAGLFGREAIPMDPKLQFLLMHAEDIFMTTMSEKELIRGLLKAELRRVERERGSGRGHAERHNPKVAVSRRV